MLPLLKSDLLEIMQAVGGAAWLAEAPVEFSDARLLRGAGLRRLSPEVRDGLPHHHDRVGCAHIYVAGAKEEDGQLVTSGGRVLGVTAVAEDLPNAIQEAIACLRPSPLKTRTAPRHRSARASGIEGGVMVFRVYVEKKAGFAPEAARCCLTPGPFGSPVSDRRPYPQPLRRGGYRPGAV